MGKSRWLSTEIVVATAAGLANEAGTADDLTLTQLAQALDVRVPSLYSHVSGLPGLRRELSLFGLRKLAACLRQAAAGKSGREALLSSAHAYRQFAYEWRGIYGLTLRAPQPGDQAIHVVSEEIIQFLLLIMASCGLSGDEALHAIRGYRAVLHGFVSLETAGGYGLPLSRDESFQRLVTTFIDGLSPPEPVSHKGA